MAEPHGEPGSTERHAHLVLPRHVDLSTINKFLGQLPIADWIRLAQNTLKQLGLFVSLLFISFLVVWFFPDGFTADQRFDVLKVIGILVGLDIVSIFVLTIWPGDRLYSPNERILQRDHRYGTNQRPMTRRRALDEQAVPPQRALPDAGESEPR